MLPYGVGVDSISARAIWGNAEPHGRALLAPTMHFFDSLRLPSEGSSKVRSPLGPLCEGAPPAGGGGENCTAVRNISGYGKVLSLRPFGAPPSQREAFRHAGLPLEGSHYIGGAPKGSP